MDNDEQRKLDRKAAAQEKIAKTFTPAHSVPKKRKLKAVPVKSRNGGMVELMKIKSQAKGPANVPAASRIYIYVQCPKESKIESQSLYFDKVTILHYEDLVTIIFCTNFISYRKLRLEEH